MAALPPGTVQLAGGPPRHPAGAKVPAGPPPPPPPPPPGPRPGDAGPPIRPAMTRPTAPAVPSQLLRQPQPFPMPPPNEVIPLELRRKQLVERSDIRGERMTEADAREALSEYVVFRLEKVQDPNEIDDEGYPAKSTWEDVVRTEVTDLSKPAITRTIRELNAEGTTGLQKQMALTATQQRQIERAQNDLDMRDPDKRYCYTLQQIDSKRRKLSKESIEYRQYMAGRESKKVAVTKKKEHKSKTLFETTALTVYFKREPRPGESAIAMLKSREKDAEQQRQILDQHRQHQHAQQLMAEQQRHELMLNHQHQQFQRHLHPQVLSQPHPPAKAPPGLKKKPEIKVIELDPRKDKPKIYAVSPKSSRSSRSSNSDDSCSDTGTTPESSVASSTDSAKRGRHHHRHRRHSRSRSCGHDRSRSRTRSRSHRRYYDRPEEYGVRVSRHHTKHDQHYILGSDMPGERIVAAPLHLSPLPMNGVVEIIVDEALLPRRKVDVGDALVLSDSESLNDLEFRRRNALPARIIQRRPGVRIVDAEEVALQRHEDDLGNLRRLKIREQMRVESDRQYEDDFVERREDDIRKRQQMNRRFRRSSVEPGTLFRRRPEETWDERAAREYMTHQERQLRPLMDNPFDPLGRAARMDFLRPARYH
ncbi:hypothetical protein CCHL11_09041 [Colletotrichum chlorophyti]|uniref:Uncharacterized protein n=1 Tax=Colletotrichum chlorophyti TaxID=708187 RepID=A0A1Q8RAS4_9PEZI|nr:hypothetical protein CCHL11_09041 [Colletotrichum chlorophyti]